MRGVYPAGGAAVYREYRKANPAFFVYRGSRLAQKRREDPYLKDHMNIFIPLFLVLSALSMAGAPAAEAAGQKACAEDILVGSMFKTMAKAYLATVDIKGFKENTINQLNAFDEQGFHRHYARFFRVVDKSPRLSKEFGLSPNMPREKALAVVRSLDKKKLSRMIDAVPNPVVNEEFKLYLSREKIKSRDKNIADQVRMVWAKLQEGLE